MQAGATCVLLLKKPGSGSHKLVVMLSIRLVEAAQEVHEVSLVQVVQEYWQGMRMKLAGSGKYPAGLTEVHNKVLGLMYGVVAGQLLLFPIVQSALQPSPSMVLLSSHCYVPTRIPSPQTDKQVKAVDNVKPVLQI